MIQQLVSILGSIYKQSMSVFKIHQMIHFARSLPCKIHRMMPICLLADTSPTLVDLPRLISIPNSPFSIRHPKSPLEPLPEPPLG